MYFNKPVPRERINYFYVMPKLISWVASFLIESRSKPGLGDTSLINPPPSKFAKGWSC
jgi:hypothetical protein